MRTAAALHAKNTQRPRQQAASDGMHDTSRFHKITGSVDDRRMNVMQRTCMNQARLWHSPPRCQDRFQTPRPPEPGADDSPGGIHRQQVPLLRPGQLHCKGGLAIGRGRGPRGQGMLQADVWVPRTPPGHICQLGAAQLQQLLNLVLLWGQYNCLCQRVGQGSLARCDRLDARICTCGTWMGTSIKARCATHCSQGRVSSKRVLRTVETHPPKVETAARRT